MKESGSLLSKSLLLIVVSKLSAQRRFEEKKGKEGREDKRRGACCISILPAERLSVCLWQQPREGDTLCILTQLVYLFHCHCLSLPLSVSACLSLRRSPRVCLLDFSLRSAPACHGFSPLWNFFSSVVCLYLSIARSPAVIFQFIFLISILSSVS